MDVKLSEHIQGLDEELAGIIEGVVGLNDEICSEFPLRRGVAGTQNIYGDEQMALDVWANDVIIGKLRELPQVKAVVSEEEDEPVLLSESGSYTVTLDPLDGSSNIKSNNIFGTIVGIHKEKELLTQGKNQVASFYHLYGPINTMVLCDGKKVSEYMEIEKDGKLEFYLSKDDIRIPEDGKLVGPGGLLKKWPDWLTDFIRQLFGEGKKLRYGGAFVGDFNQVLTYGGMFCYPELVDKPQGKLRLVIECNPMSFIMEAAGGASSDGTKSILEVKPEKADHRTPVYVGNKEIIEKLEEAKAKA